MHVHRSDQAPQNGGVELADIGGILGGKSGRRQNDGRDNQRRSCASRLRHHDSMRYLSLRALAPVNLSTRLSFGRDCLVLSAPAVTVPIRIRAASVEQQAYTCVSGAIRSVGACGVDVVAT